MDTTEQQNVGTDDDEEATPVTPASSEPSTETAVDEAPIDEMIDEGSPVEGSPVREAPAEDEPEAPAAAAVTTTEPGSDNGEVAGELEDEEEEEDVDDFFAPGDWFVVHTYAGYENKVKANLASRIQSMNMEDKIYDVVVPTEEVMELKSGKMQSVQKKVFPGYILVRMQLDDDSWYVVRNTPGVTGFVGSGAKPTPLDHSEVTKILAPKTEDRPKPKLSYEIGEVVSVVGGAFAGYSGPVETIDQEKQQVRVLLDLFGRETPVELMFDQVTKL
ncbi:MAG: transcription termination/antitermination protein NusG [Actinomycetota bacterium]